MNMTAAAQLLFLSQSAVSQAIAELESQYGVRLFERLSRKLYLTDAGQKLQSYARHIIRMNEEAEVSMKSLHENGFIRIGASVTVGAYVLPKLVAEFKRASPLTEIEVFENNTQEIEKLALSNQIDIGLVEGDIASGDIVSNVFMEDELILICGTGHRFATLPFVERQELAQEAFLVREQGSGTRKTFENMMAMANLPWKATWTCNNADTIKMAVAEGLGVSVISRLAVKKELATGLLCAKAVNGLTFNRQFKLIYHKNKYLTPTILRFIEHCLRSASGASGE